MGWRAAVLLCVSHEILDSEDTLDSHTPWHEWPWVHTHEPMLSMYVVVRGGLSVKLW